MQGICNLRKCKKCGEPFDIANNNEICPRCRSKKIQKYSYKNERGFRRI